VINIKNLSLLFNLMPFDANLFESLSGYDLGNYTARLMEEDLAEPEFIPYFSEKSLSMDLLHLESAICLLGKVGTEACFRKVAEYLQHENFRIRFVATRIISRMPIVDHVIMKSVAICLVARAGDEMDLAQELRVVLDRPANAKARRIATECQMSFSRRDIC